MSPRRSNGTREAEGHTGIGGFGDQRIRVGSRRGTSPREIDRAAMRGAAAIHRELRPGVTFCIRRDRDGLTESGAVVERAHHTNFRNTIRPREFVCDMNLAFAGNDYIGVLNPA